MAILCNEHAMVFVMAPRTACTAVGEVLLRDGGGEYLPAEDLLGAKGAFVLQRKHNTISELIEHGLLSRTDANRLFKFTCVRNPFDSLVSFYLKKRSKYQPLLDDPDSWVHRVPGYVADMQFCRNHSFEEWVIRKYGGGRWRSRLWVKQRSLSHKYTEGVDFVMRYERLQKDFNEALRRAGVGQELTIPQVNKTEDKRKHYREYYTPKARRIVERVFRRELDQYGYAF